MTASNYYDNLNRLLRTEFWAGTNLVARSVFGYNPANQRMAMTNADNTYWLYDYDFLGQVKSAKKHWADGTLVAGQQPLRELRRETRQELACPVEAPSGELS